MKPFDKLTETELLALEDDQIRRYIDLECAEAGVPLLPPPPGPAPAKPDVDPDVDVFTVGELHFQTAEAAAAAIYHLSTLPRYELKYVSGPSYEKKAVPADEPLTVQPKKAYSPERWEAVREALVAHATAKKQHEAEVAEYRNAESTRNNIAAEIHDRIGRAYAAERRRQTLGAQYDRYLELADGNGAVAARFLASAYPDARDVLPHLYPQAEEPAEAAA